jgi:hypothetical protein
MERERERVKMAPAGNQHRQNRGWGGEWTGWRVMKEMKLATAVRLYIVPLSFLPSLFRLYTSPINFSLSLSLSRLREGREKS